MEARKAIAEFLFPAHAGVILIELRKTDEFCAFPRTRGGDPRFLRFFSLQLYFSPHTRG